MRRVWSDDNGAWRENSANVTRRDHPKHSDVCSMR